MTPPWSRSVVHMVYFVLRAPLCLAFAGKVQSFQIGGSALVPFLVNAMFDPDRRGLNLGQEKAKKNLFFMMVLRMQMEIFIWALL